MDDDRGQDNQSIETSNLDRRDKNRRVNLRAIAAIAVGLAICTTASVFMLNNLFQYLEMRENATPARPAGANVQARKLPPEPRLQESAIQDLQQLRVGEDRILNSYGWADEKKGAVRIPIQRAIDLLAQRGLPVRAPHGMTGKILASNAVPKAGPGSEVQ